MGSSPPPGRILRFGQFELDLATFLNLWKDADPSLLLLKQAKAEYAKLHLSE